MGRLPITLNEAQVVEVETLAALLNQDQIADYFGIARNTFRAICERDTEVLEHYKRGKARAIAHVANGLLLRARAGDTTCAIFYLKTQGGWRDQGPVEQEPPPKTTSARDTLSEMLAELAKKNRRIGDGSHARTIEHEPEHAGT